MAKFNSESGRIAGRKSSWSGIKDVNTQRMKSIIRAALVDESKYIHEALAQLRGFDAKAYIDAIVKLLPYAIPKVAEIEEKPQTTWPSKVVFNVIEETPPPSESKWILNSSGDTES